MILHNATASRQRQQVKDAQGAAPRLAVLAGATYHIGDALPHWHSAKFGMRGMQG